MQYVYSLPTAAAFKGKGLAGCTFGPLKQTDLDVYYIEVDGGHDTFMISKKITRTYYILSGSGSFTIDNCRYAVGPGMLVEVPPKVEYTYSGKMTLVAFSRPGWSFGNDRHTRWNADVFGADFAAPLPNVKWRSRILRWRIFGISPVAAGVRVNQAVWNLLPIAVTSVAPLRRYGGLLHKLAARLGANQDDGGVHGPSFKPPEALERPSEEMPKFQTEPRKSGRPGL